MTLATGRAAAAGRSTGTRRVTFRRPPATLLYMPVDDALLVAHARIGDADAYAALLTRHHTRLLRACAHALGDRDAAADIAQEAALIGWLQLDRLREPAHFGPWLTGIGRNLALRVARERSTRLQWITPDMAPPDQPSSEADDPAERLLA